MTVLPFTYFGAPRLLRDAHDKIGFFRKFRESSAWELKHTVFVFGDFSLSVQRSESHCREDVSGRKALDEIR
jgi:hypothetical protein